MNKDSYHSTRGLLLKAAYRGDAGCAPVERPWNEVVFRTGVPHRNLFFPGLRAVSLRRSTQVTLGAVAVHIIVVSLCQGNHDPDDDDYSQGVVGGRSERRRPESVDGGESQLALRAKILLQDSFLCSSLFHEFENILLLLL